MWARGKVDERVEMRISRAATIALSAVAIGLSILFEHVNVAFMVGLSRRWPRAPFPVLAMSIFWRGMTTRRVLGGGLGLVSAVMLTVLSKSVWSTCCTTRTHRCSLDNPALVSVPLRSSGIVVGSLGSRRGARRERDAFAQQEFYAQTGRLAAPCSIDSSDEGIRPIAGRIFSRNPETRISLLPHYEKYNEYKGLTGFRNLALTLQYKAHGPPRPNYYSKQGDNR